MPVDIISADQLSKITAGIKTGEKDKPKPLVEKIADARPAEDAVGKITEKKEIVTASAWQSSNGNYSPRITGCDLHGSNTVVFLPK